MDIEAAGKGKADTGEAGTSSLSLGQKDNADIMSGEVTALLEQGTSFEGRLTFEGTVRIGGHFKGEIFTRDTLIINPGARVEAQIEADVVVVCGHLQGNVFARRQVLMHPPATFSGSVTTPSLRIDEGVVFEGASHMPKPN